MAMDRSSGDFGRPDHLLHFRSDQHPQLVCITDLTRSKKPPATREALFIYFISLKDETAYGHVQRIYPKRGHSE